MKGKEHMIVGTTATATMGIGFLLTNTISSVIYLVPLILGGFIIIFIMFFIVFYKIKLRNRKKIS